MIILLSQIFVIFVVVLRFFWILVDPVLVLGLNSPTCYKIVAIYLNF
jgi:hypothetical protein